MLLQANDFRHLCENLDVEMQMGGSDQWGNITAGTDLIRRRLSRPAYGLTWPLLTRSDGKKMGKSVHGALWLDADKTSPYQFRQYWIQLPDEDVGRFLLQLSLRSCAEIDVLMEEHAASPDKRIAQIALADDMTRLVHGESAQKAAAEAAAILFGADPLSSSLDALRAVAREVPSTRVRELDLGDVVALLVTIGLSTSKGEARRLLAQNGVKVNGGALEETGVGGRSLADIDRIHGRFLLLRRGRTSFHLVDVAGE